MLAPAVLKGRHHLGKGVFVMSLVSRFGFTFVLAAVALTGCAAQTDGEDDVSSDGEEIVGVAKHRAAMDACNKKKSGALGRASTNIDIVDAHVAYEKCLATANDATLARIAANIASAGRRYSTGTPAHAFDVYRRAAGPLCELAADAGMHGGGTAEFIDIASCHAERERIFGRLIEANVALGGNPTLVPEDKAYAACYRTWERAPRPDTHASMQAAAKLAECIEKDVDAISKKIGIDTNGNFSKRSAAVAERNFRFALAKAFEAGGAACSVLGDAGENGGGTASLPQIAHCRADASALLGHLLVSTSAR
jgi:hypothetical protein